MGFERTNHTKDANAVPFSSRRKRNSVAECRTVSIGIVPLCRVVTPVYKHRDNDCTQWCNLDSESCTQPPNWSVYYCDSKIFIVQKQNDKKMQYVWADSEGGAAVPSTSWPSGWWLVPVAGNGPKDAAVNEGPTAPINCPADCPDVPVRGLSAGIAEAVPAGGAATGAATGAEGGWRALCERSVRGLGLWGNTSLLLAWPPDSRFWRE